MLDLIHPDLRHLAVPIDELNEDPKNANAHSERNLASIAESFKRFGQRKPIVVRREGMTVEAGNGTLASLRAEGWTHLACIVCDDDEQTATAYGLVDNQSARLAEWDPDALRERIDELTQGGYDVQGLGWNADEIVNVLAGNAQSLVDQLGTNEASNEQGAAGSPPKSAVTEEHVPPSHPAVPVTQTGDLWLLGEHRLLCGDSMLASDRERLLNGEIAAMGLMDPPFAIYGSSTGIGADIADDKMIRPFFVQLGQAIMGSVVEFAHVYVCCDWRSWASVWAGMAAAKLTPKNCLVWDKGDGGMGSTYQQCHEFVGMFARLPPPTAMSGSTQRGQRIVMGRPNILRHNRPHGDERLHNAAKPVAMMAGLIENSSDAGDLVLDLFNGSGTVLIAGEQTGRKVYAMEMEPSMCDVTVARWERLTGQKAQRVPAQD